LVLEGRSPAWGGPAQQWRRRETELRAAGYRDHPTLRFRKEGEIRALVKDLPGRRWNHVQVIREDNRDKVYAHTEPHGETDPLTHIYCALTEEGINFGAGASMLRSDLRDARRYIKTETYQESVRSGMPSAMGACSICGHAIWSRISLARGIGSWCYAHKR